MPKLIMTKEQLAKALNGCEYREELSKTEEIVAKESGLVVVFGASDDLMEFRGHITDEIGAWRGTTVLVLNGEIVDQEGGQVHCTNCLQKAKSIEAIWGKDGYSWTYKTAIPHATFDVLEDGETYCRGIVFHINDITTAPCGY